MVGVDPIIPAAVVMEFLRSRIEQNRGAVRADLDAALTFGVVRADDGLTDWWSIYVAGPRVTVENDAVPIEYGGRLVTLYADEAALSDITRGGRARGVEVEGDADLLSEVSKCFGDGLLRGRG